MTDILDELATKGTNVPDTTSTQDTTPSSTPETSQDGTTDSTTAEGTDSTTSASSSPYGDILGTFATMDEAEAAGFTDLVNAPDFANKLTVERVTAAVLSNTDPMAAYIQLPNVYTAMRASRHPIPVVIVDGAALLPYARAAVAFNERPVRGEGSAEKSTDMSDEKLIRLTGQNLVNLEKMQATRKKLDFRIEKAQKLVDTRSAIAAKRFGEDWENKARAAYAEYLSTQDASKEISDDDDEAQAA